MGHPTTFLVLPRGSRLEAAPPTGAGDPSSSREPRSELGRRGRASPGRPLPRAATAAGQTREGCRPPPRRAVSRCFQGCDVVAPKQGLVPSVARSESSLVPLTLPTRAVTSLVALLVEGRMLLPTKLLPMNRVSPATAPSRTVTANRPPSGWSHGAAWTPCRFEHQFEQRLEQQGSPFRSSVTSIFVHRTGFNDSQYYRHQR